MTDTLLHVHPEDWAAVRALPIQPLERLALLADLCRLDTLYMVRRAGSGHLGSSFSSLDIVAWLFRDALLSGGGPVPAYFSSKGHDAPGLYSVLLACRKLPADKLHTLRRLGGLPGHPDVNTPGMLANCGSLGMGISKAKGLVTAARLRGESTRLTVMTGDGELQEGQIWESLAGAVQREMSELRVVVDHNKIQSDSLVSRVSDLGDLPAKFAAFGWNVERCDGHDLVALGHAFASLDARSGPGVVIADTVKGKGVSFMEGLAPGDDLYRFHSGAPDLATFNRAVEELRDRVDSALREHGKVVRLTRVDITLPSPGSAQQRLVPAYTAALLDLAARDERVIALDGDLVLDTGLIPFAEKFPERFIECGIAEQDMVGQAGGLALSGMLPVVHSFACFLTPRAAEQIGTNASERTKVLYVGSLAGIVPGGPGHSHQMIRDVALMSSVPEMLIAEPAVEAEVAPLLYALATEGPDRAGYLRLVSVPVEVPFDLPASHTTAVGQGWTVRDGADLLVLGAGPVILSGLWRAAALLSEQHRLEVRVVALPWLNEVDASWFAELVAPFEAVATVENHLVVGGMGASVRAALDVHPGKRFMAVGMTAFPACGLNDEVLQHHGYDPVSLATSLLRHARP